MKRPVWLWLLFLFGFTGLEAHEIRPAFLELRAMPDESLHVLWKIPAIENGEPAPVTLETPAGWQEVETRQRRFVGDAFIDEKQLRVPADAQDGEFRITGLEQVKVDTLVRVVYFDGQSETALVKARQPIFIYRNTEGTGGVAVTYIRLGVEHILLGVDHLLFVLGLIMLVDRRWMLIKTITAFTIAHSLTLALSVFAIIHVPEGPLNVAIALSILFLGPEIVRKWRGESSLTLRHPWVVAFGFGLLHGIGFSSGLSVTGLPKEAIPPALLFFNVGVELGQIAFVGLAIGTGQAIKTLELNRPIWIERIPGYAVGTLGAFWTWHWLAIWWLSF